MREFDVVVIGCGAAGLMSAYELAKKNVSVLVVARGLGATAMSSGSIDLMGYLPSGAFAENPLDAVGEVAEKYPQHPYGVLGGGFESDPDERRKNAMLRIRKALSEFLSIEFGVKYVGDLNRNVFVSNPLGTLKPTALYQISMRNGALENLSDKSIHIIGFKGYSDFDASFYANSLAYFAKILKIKLKDVKSMVISLPTFENKQNILAINIARLLEKEDYLNIFAKTIINNLKGEHADIIGLPAVLGLENTENIIKRLEEQLGSQVFEIPSLPPSVPGLRLQQKLERTVSQCDGAKIIKGIEVLKIHKRNRMIEKTEIGMERRREEIRCSAVILATGGFTGGGLKEHEGEIVEGIFGLPVCDQRGKFLEGAKVLKLLREDLFSKDGHPVFAVGVKVDNMFRPVGLDEVPVCKNLFAAGAILSGYNRISEKSGLGVAISTGYFAGNIVANFVG